MKRNTVNQPSRWTAPLNLLWRGMSGLAIATLISVITALPSMAQELLREGKLQFVMLQGLANETAVLSRGMLADLETDPNFSGNYEMIYNDAFMILEGFTPVARGGFFPENAGIPRELQLTVDEAVYRLYRLEEGTELMLYRSPQENTSRYFIREN